MAQDTSRRMQGMAVLGGAVLLGSTFLSPPVSAQTAEELRTQIQALSQRVEELEASKVATPVIAPAQAVTAGDVPRSIKLPGTNTSLVVGGYVQLNVDWTEHTPVGARNNPHGGFFPAPPLDGTVAASRGPDFLMEAQQSRFWIRTWTPSDLGRVTTYLSGDFNGSPYGTSTNLRLRHGYGTLGNFLAGQTWQLFGTVLGGSGGETLDFEGPDGDRQTSRRAQIKYTVPFSGGSFQVAAEQAGGTAIAGAGLPVVTAAVPPAAIPIPAGGVFAGSPAFTVPAGHFTPATTLASTVVTRLPQGIVRVNVGGDWGAGWVAGMLREMRTDAPGGALDFDDAGWGVQGGVRIPTFGKDSVAGTFVFGSGINGNVEFTAATLAFDARDEWGFSVSYERWWTDNLRSTVVYGRDEFDNSLTALGAAGFAAAIDEAQTVHVNLIWSPVSRVEFGGEWMWFERETEAGVEGDNQRVQFVAKYSF